MIRLIHAEFVKLRTTQVWIWMLVAAIAVTALITIGNLAGNGVKDYSDVLDVLTAGGSSYIVVFVLGVLGVTTEFRYQTITPTVLTTPSRWALITAKLITYALVGALYAFVCLVIEVAIALPWFSAKGLNVSLTGPHVPRALLGVFAVVALFGIVGLGVGALLKNQIVAVSVGVIFLLVINSLLAAIPGVKHVYPYTPVGAANAVFSVVGDRTVNHVELLPGLGGVVVLVLWAFVPAILGASLTLNRDIT